MGIIMKAWPFIITIWQPAMFMGIPFMGIWKPPFWLPTWLALRLFCLRCFFFFGGPRFRPASTPEKTSASSGLICCAPMPFSSV